MFALKSSTRAEKFNERRPAFGSSGLHSICIKLKRDLLRLLYLLVDFGDRFAYKAAMPSRAK